MNNSWYLLVRNLVVSAAKTGSFSILGLLPYLHMASVQWFQYTKDAITTNFCPDCGALLPLPENSTFIECSICYYHCSTQQLSDKVIVTKSKKKVASRNQKKILTYAAMIKDGSVLCPQCSHNELSFKTAQLRAADEGQTIFYECTKCLLNWSVNT